MNVELQLRRLGRPRARPRIFYSNGTYGSQRKQVDSPISRERLYPGMNHASGAKEPLRDAAKLILHLLLKAADSGKDHPLVRRLAPADDQDAPAAPIAAE